MPAARKRKEEEKKKKEEAEKKEREVGGGSSLQGWAPSRLGLRLSGLRPSTLCLGPGVRHPRRGYFCPKVAPSIWLSPQIPPIFA